MTKLLIPFTKKQAQKNKVQGEIKQPASVGYDHLMKNRVILEPGKAYGVRRRRNTY